jgi:SHAQKYF class myb-like DNA-binding protein
MYFHGLTRKSKWAVVSNYKRIRIGEIDRSLKPESNCSENHCSRANQIRFDKRKTNPSTIITTDLSKVSLAMCHHPLLGAGAPKSMCDLPNSTWAHVFSFVYGDAYYVGNPFFATTAGTAKKKAENAPSKYQQEREQQQKIEEDLRDMPDSTFLNIDTTSELDLAGLRDALGLESQARQNLESQKHLNDGNWSCNWDEVQEDIGNDLDPNWTSQIVLELETKGPSNDNKGQRIRGSQAAAVSSDGTRRIGTWTDEEKAAFVTGLNTYGRNWKDVRMLIKTRTLTQIRTHAQKFFRKVNRERELAIERCDTEAEQEADRLLATTRSKPVPAGGI